MVDKIGRNDPCPCGSGKKYKKCYLDVGRDLKKKSEMECGLPPHDKYIFDTKEEIIESISAEGFEPDVSEHVDEEEGQIFRSLNVNLRCKHGFTANERNFVLQDDNRWELIEERIDDPCPECENTE